MIIIFRPRNSEKNGNNTKLSKHNLIQHIGATPDRTEQTESSAI